MRWLIGLILILSTPAFAGWDLSQTLDSTSSTTQGWVPWGIGGAGYVPKFQLEPVSGTAVVERDQGICSIAKVATGTGANATHWYDVLSFNSMPANTVTLSSGAPGYAQCDQLSIDTATVSNLWLSFRGQLFRSTNGTVANFINKTATFSLVSSYPAQDPSTGAMQYSKTKNIQPTIVVDPKNSDVVYAGTPAGGLYFSNTGTSTATFSQVTSVLAALTTNGALDTSTTTNTPGSGSCAVNSTTCTFTLSSSHTWATGTGTTIKAYGTSAHGQQIYGTVDPATSGTSLVIDVQSVMGGSSTSSWTITHFINSNSDNNQNFGNHVIAFDGASGRPTVSVSGQTRSKNIYECTFGFGIYQSTDGGVSWQTTAAGGPTDCQQMVVDPNGILWMTDFTNAAVWNYSAAGGTWSELTHPPVGFNSAIAIDPNNCSSEATCRVAIATGDFFAYTETGGQGSGGNQSNGWSWWQNFKYTSPNIGWSAPWYQHFGFIGVGGLQFDSGGTLWRSDEVMLTATPTLTDTFPNYSEQTIGEEEFETNSIVVVNGNAIIGGWDVACMLSSAAYRPGGAALQTCPVPTAPGLHHVYQLDADGNNIAALGDNQWTTFTYIPYMGFSNDGGVSWHTMPVPDPSYLVGTNNSGGCIAMSGTQSMIVVSSDNNQGQLFPYYTSDGGQHWTHITVSGQTITEGFPGAYFDNYHSCAHDTGTANTFYIYGYRGCTTCTPTDDYFLKCVGSSCTVIVQGPGLAVTAAFNGTLKTPPGNGGYFFFASEFVLPGSVGTGNSSFYYWHGSSLVNITTANRVTAFGFGGAIGGHTFPSIWIAGFVNNVYGIYRCGTFDTDQCGSNADWIASTTYPNGNPMTIYDIAGDPSNSHVVYAGTASGAFRGYLN